MFCDTVFYDTMCLSLTFCSLTPICAHNKNYLIGDDIHQLPGMLQQKYIAIKLALRYLVVIRLKYIQPTECALPSPDWHNYCFQCRMYNTLVSMTETSKFRNLYWFIKGQSITSLWCRVSMVHSFLQVPVSRAKEVSLVRQHQVCDGRRRVWWERGSVCTHCGGDSCEPCRVPQGLLEHPGGEDEWLEETVGGEWIHIPLVISVIFLVLLVSFSLCYLCHFPTVTCVIFLVLLVSFSYCYLCNFPCIIV